jgi:hypothetical protein
VLVHVDEEGGASGFDAHDVQRFQGSLFRAAGLQPIHDGVGARARYNEADPGQAKWPVDYSHLHICQVRVEVAAAPGRNQRPVHVDHHQPIGHVLDLRVLGKQESIQSLAKIGGEAAGHVEDGEVPAVDHPQVGDHPALRRQLGGITHCSYGQRQHIVGEQSLQPDEAIGASHLQRATVSPADDGRAASEGLVAVEGKHG